MDTCGRTNGSRLRVDAETLKRKEKFAFSNLSGYVWTGPYTTKVAAYLVSFKSETKQR